MSNKQWNVHCPHCGASFTKDHDGLMAGHTLVLARGVGESHADRIREITENFEIECPECGRPVPFEPRSLFRRRKLGAMSHRFTALTDLEKNPDKPWEPKPMGEGEARVLDLTCRAAGVLYQSLEGDIPLELVRENCGKLMAAVEHEVASMGPGANNAEPLRLLREMASIAQADIGEREDLVDVSADEVKAEQERLAAILHRSMQGQAKPAASESPVAAKSKCFIATAACGTPDHPLVEILRDFRDCRLARNRAGRTLIRLYERFSPPVAGWISARPLARRVVRACVVRPAAFCARLVV